MPESDKTPSDAFLESFKGIFEMVMDWAEDLSSKFEEKSAFTRAVEGANHPLWLLGHLTWLTDSLLAEIPSGETFREKDWDRFFRIGCERFPDSEYPGWDLVRRKFSTVRSKIRDRLDLMDAADLTKPCLNPGEWFPAPIDGMHHFIRDFNYHLGQMSIALRAVDPGAGSPPGT